MGLIGSGLYWAGSVSAEPILQLDIAGGTYVGGDEESMVSAGGVFTLYSYLNLENGLAPLVNLDTQFSLSIAVIPSFTTEPAAAPDLGSFAVNGTTYDVTGDMTWGTPPMATEDLPGHGVFDTYYLEVTYEFVASQTAQLVDVQDDGGLGPQGTGGMYWVAFDFDVTGLVNGYNLHFDTYDTDHLPEVKAPFSHDARTGVPEPGTLLLLSAGLLGAAFSRRGRRQGNRA